MAKLEVNTYENTGATKDTAPYLGTFVSKGSIDFATLAKQVSKLSGLPPIQAETILRGGIDELAKLERDGAVRINFDGGCIHLVIKGTFDSSDAAFDPEKNSLELAIRLSDDIRNSLANETPKIVTDGTSTKVRLDTVADVETPRPYQLIHGTKPFMCTGINLVTTDAGAEVHLENAIGTKFPCVVDEVVSKQEFTAHLSAAVEPGDYKLVVKSRGGDAEGPLQTTFRKVKVLAAVPPYITSVTCEGHEDDPDKLFDGCSVTIHGVGLADAGTAMFEFTDKAGAGHEFTLGATAVLPFPDGKQASRHIAFG